MIEENDYVCLNRNYQKIQKNMIVLFWMTFFSLTMATDVFENFDFNGKRKWEAEMLDLCESDTFTTHTYAENICLRYVVDYTYQNVEILSYDPILIQFHGFYTEKDSLAFIEDTTQIELKPSTVFENGVSTLSEFRNANGTWMGHTQTPQSKKMFANAQRKLPNMKFKAAEDWQVLSYHPGGHYAPHCDFIEFEEEEGRTSSWMMSTGNRVATFLAVLQTADAGGGTVFPTIGVTVKPNVGDVIFWFNQNVNGSISEESLHGACPIRAGQKIAATLWIHRIGNELKYKAVDEKHFDINAFVNPQYFRRAEGEEAESIVDYGSLRDSLRKDSVGEQDANTS